MPGSLPARWSRGHTQIKPVHNLLGAGKAGFPPSRTQATNTLRLLLRQPHRSRRIQPNQRRQTTNGQASFTSPPYMSKPAHAKKSRNNRTPLFSVTSGCGSCSTGGRPGSLFSPTQPGEPRRRPPPALMTNPRRSCYARRRSPRRPPPVRWPTFRGSSPSHLAGRRRPRRTPRFSPRGRWRRRPCRRGVLLLEGATSGSGWWRCRGRS